MQFQKERTFDVIVIGGGAAGLMACGRAAEQGKSVLLLEKNARLGEKLCITGGGRCNVANAEENERTLLSHYGAASKFLFSPFSQFSMKDTFAFFERMGVPLVVQALKRAFPHTEKATDILAALERYARQSKVVLKTGAAVTKIRSSGNEIRSVHVGSVEYRATSYILSTGGVSHPETGSTGDGFKWLQNSGHTVRKPTPSIVPLAVQDEWIKKLAGVTLPSVRITFKGEERADIVRTGSVLCTHFGLSGPLILNAATAVSDLLHAGPVPVRIDLYPHDDVVVVERKLLAAIESGKNKQFKNMMRELLPAGTADALIPLFEDVIDTSVQVNAVSKEQRRLCAERLKALPCTVTGLMGYDRAVVADGGVALEEVDMRTMRSLRVSNLFIVGDLLDIYRPSGGYSLQLCWTTGYVAGSHA